MGEDVTVAYTVKELRDAGCAVVIFSKEELRGADPRLVQDAVIAAGWELIDAARTVQHDSDR